ncbi:uncharacterized protein SPAPADRAFT_131008 [Spathaspora passalidarum NRRL Y-27907]|uniref:Rab-GAP TBC domain-containing protein n=1 Tax=Spathaspora passalidarum (strain NRRL Y-27907 / 11-Y1) TaxID=619300 RepID=G3AED4_SPAPN|nr:uncharacterized protein SPAPADRAFT_131008 [Spathaspora passalidarum NRRL Y-27907]EGW35722.1 hypothetical protein SPAPADRAFT_131008 [Spathaspora passalidarum NRRL Y-27907]
MAFFDALREKAVTTLNQVLDKNRNSGLTKHQQFCYSHHIPETETILSESAAEIGIKSDYSTDAYNDNLPFPQGRIYLTQSFLIFRDAFDRKNCSFSVHLSTIKKVERPPGSDYGFALMVSTYSKLHLTLYLVGIRSDSERFAQQLKIALKKNLVHVGKLQPFIQTCYSEYLLAKNKVSTEKVEHAPQGGLGLVFKFPGDPKESRDKTKMKLWFDLFRVDGRNLSLVRTPLFYKLVRVGLPNRLRGEIWELCCGSMYLRLDYQGEYNKILEDHKDQKSFAIEEIEKDLNRSLPEYAAYQSSQGIERLRRVLTAYSWKNPDVGYCQAMNIVVAAMLIYMSEEQAFWCLNVLCDRIVPGYYSKTMYGTLLDQKVFESLVQKTMPMLWEHITKNDIQLSVVSLPWFLSLYLSSMPLVFAFRILDVFFLQGPKTLFQVALAVLKLNGEALLNTEDDGTFISIIKQYFLTLHESAHPNSPNPKFRSITRFQELLVTAFREFSVIDEEMINNTRAKHRDTIYQNISSFVKRTELRNLPRTTNISQETLSLLYDRFYSVVESLSVTKGSGTSVMDYKVFVEFMSEICDWITDVNVDDERHFLRRLFNHWDTEKQGALTFTDLLVGLNSLVDPDLMTSMSNFFELYDTKGDGKIDREGILQISEDLLYITSPWKDGVLFDGITKANIENVIADEVYKKQVESGNTSPDQSEIQLPSDFQVDRDKLEQQQVERYLQAAATFIQRAFEYAQPEEEELLIKELAIDNSISHNAALNPNTPVYLNLPTFRMVVLADETYELLFGSTLREATHLERPLDTKFDPIRNLRDMFDGLLADGRKVATKVRLRMDSRAANGGGGAPPNSSNASIKSGAKREEEEEDQDDDDLGVISIDDNDKDLLLATEAQVVVKESTEKPRISRMESEKIIGKSDQNLIEFET